MRTTRDVSFAKFAKFEFEWRNVKECWGTGEERDRGGRRGVTMVIRSSTSSTFPNLLDAGLKIHQLLPTLRTWTVMSFKSGWVGLEFVGLNKLAFPLFMQRKCPSQTDYYSIVGSGTYSNQKFCLRRGDFTFVKVANFIRDGYLPGQLVQMFNFQLCGEELLDSWQLI